MKLFTLGLCFGAGEIYKDMFNSVVVLHSPGGHNSKQLLQTIAKEDVILYGGGEDISPSLYNESAHRFTMAPSSSPSLRDSFEAAAFSKGLEIGAGHYGICRGAQILCALSGGNVVQHVTNHAGSNHWIDTKDGMFLTSSAHHQMMWPYDMATDKFQILGTSVENLSTVYAFNNEKIVRKIDYKEPEIVFFPKTRALGIQGHPEFINERAPFVQYSRKLLQDYLLERSK